MARKVAFNPISGKFDLVDNYADLFAVLSEPTGFPNRTDSAFTMTGRDFEISPAVTSFSYWIDGVEYVIDAQKTIEITDVDGQHVIYFDTDKTLKEYVNPTVGEMLITIRDKAIVAVAYWNATENELVYLGEERHGCIMSGMTHYYLHYTRGLQLVSGLGLGDFVISDGADDEDAQFSVETGSIADEDLGLTVDAIGSTTGLPILYREGASGVFRTLTNAGFSVYANPAGATNRLMWNEWTGATWQLSEVGNNDYVLCHVFATTGKLKQMYAVIGQSDYTTIVAARAGAQTEISNLTLGDMPTPEFRPIATVIFQTGNYGNAVNAKIVQASTGVNYVDWRTSELPRGIAPTDHRNLTSLAWTSSNHTGTANKIAAFSATGTATEIDNDLPAYVERNNLEACFNDAYDTSYAEHTYAAGLLTAVDIWDTSSKVTKLFSKTISYNVDDQIDEVVLTDEITSAVLTTTITYNVDGTVDTVEKAIT